MSRAEGWARVWREVAEAIRAIEADGGLVAHVAIAYQDGREAPEAQLWFSSEEKMHFLKIGLGPSIE